MLTITCIQIADGLYVRDFPFRSSLDSHTVVMGGAVWTSNFRETLFSMLRTISRHIVLYVQEANGQFKTSDTSV